MMFTGQRRAVGLFSTRQDAEAAMYRLRDAGFNMDRISVVAQNPNAIEELPASGSLSSTKREQTGRAVEVGAVSGAAVGGLIGLSGGLSALAIPGIGPAAGVGIVLADMLFGGAVGTLGGGLIGALTTWGIPDSRARYYYDRVYTHKEYLVLVEGSDQDIRDAEAVLRNYGIRDWEIYSSPRQPSDRTIL